jgi:two-component system, NtrC family, response regulator HydG
MRGGCRRGGICTGYRRPLEGGIAMTSEASIRCVVWFGQPAPDERAGLVQAGWRVRVADLGLQSGGIGIRRSDMAVALADLRHADADKVQAIASLMADHPDLPWLVLLTADTAVHTAEMESILSGSIDFFTAPLDMPRLIETLATLNGDGVPETASDLPGMTVNSSAMMVAVASLRKFAPVDLPVLITGETGTGKEVAARALHRLSERREHPFAAINCGALPPNLVQSELFGHERGAFTGANARRVGHFEAAAGGIVFLDEVGDLPLDAQTSLLRLLQEGTLERVGSTQSIKLDVRVMAATHVDLEKAVEHGRFREDLYYRLNVLRLRMPALREREDDVLQLAQIFLDGFRKQHGSQARAFSAVARQALRRFSWPGNVRELLNRVQRAAVVADGGLITAADLDLEDAVTLHSGRSSLGLTRTSAERDAIEACLRESRFNVSECARRLKVSRVTIYRLCKKHQLTLQNSR